MIKIRLYKPFITLTGISYSIDVNFKAMSIEHGISIAEDKIHRLGIIGRVYLESSEGHKISICILIFALSSVTVFCASPDDMGEKLWYKILKIGKWVILFRGGYDIISAATKSNKKAIVETIFMTILAYMALYFLPTILSYVETLAR